MAASAQTRVSLLVLAFLFVAVVVQCRSLRTHLRKAASLHGERRVRVSHVRRVRRDPGSECALLGVPWRESAAPVEDRGHMYLLKILSAVSDAPRRAVFPEHPLLRFVRRVYRCCQSGHHCAGVKGIQGRTFGESNVEFLLSKDVLSAPLEKAEVHFHFTNPHQLNIQPVLPSLEKRGFPTRYNAWFRDGVTEMRVDLLSLLQALRLAVGGVGRGSTLMEMHRVRGLTRTGAYEQRRRPPSLQETVPTVMGEVGEDPMRAALELGLSLHCRSEDRVARPCKNYGVHLEHAPFIALEYR